MMEFYMPVRLYTGDGSVRKHADVFSSMGSRCLIVTGASSARKSGALDDVLSVLDEAGIKSILYDRIGQNPLLSSCADAGRLGSSFQADFVIGIGGGSALDAAKAASVFAANPEADESMFYSKKWEKRPLPIILVGTTSGTGSEVTKVAVVTDSAGRKHSMHDELIYAAASFGDAKYTMGLPKAVTLSTGIDVLMHCTESYFSRKANDISRATAIQGILKLREPLSAAANGEELSYAQREELYDASILGGLAICVTGTTFPHNVGYYFTENYAVPHGFACALFLPELLEHVSACEPELAGNFFRSIGMTQSELAALAEKTLPEVSFTLSGEELVLALPRWENNGSVQSTLGNVTPDQIRHMLEKFVR